jgi:hypothetical protein
MCGCFDNCVGISVICVLTFIVSCIVCTALLYCIVYVCLFLCVLLPPTENSIAVIIIIIIIIIIHRKCQMKGAEYRVRPCGRILNSGLIEFGEVLCWRGATLLCFFMNFILDSYHSEFTLHSNQI